MKSSKPYTVLDIETSGLEINSTINFVGILTFTSKEDNGNYHIYDMANQKEECIKHLKTLDGFIGHNAKFDAKLIKFNLGIDLEIKHDTMYLCYMCSSMHDLIYKRGKWLGLKHAAMRDLGVDSWDIDLEQKKGVDTAKVGEYLKHDLYYTRRLFELYKDKINKLDLPAYNLMIKAANVYKDVECAGMPIDITQLNKTMSEYNILLIELNIKLKKFADINYNSPKQLIELLYTKYNLSCNLVTTTGQKSTGVEAMTEMKGQHEIIDLILEKRRLEKALSFLKDWRDKAIEGRLYGNFNLHTTVTGRTSSNNPNIQQVPRNKELKSVFKSKEGYAFIQFDYSQMELRTAGIVADVTAMIEAYKNGEDLHTNMAATITNKDRKDIEKKERTRAKAANFGYLYGMMPKTFVKYAKVGYGVEVSLEEATRIRNTFFETNIELLKYYKEVEKELYGNGFLTNMFGRRYRVGFENLGTQKYRRDYVRKGINFMVQSAASDYAIMAIIEIHNLYKYNEDVKIIGSVHDSILFEIKENENLYSHIKTIKSIMEKPRLVNKYIRFGKEFHIPIVVDVEMGAWGKGEEIKL